MIRKIRTFATEYIFLFKTITIRGPVSVKIPAIFFFCFLVFLIIIAIFASVLNKK